MGEVEVSRNRPRPRDHQTKAKPGTKKGFAFVRSEFGEGGEQMATCSCGAEKFHRRGKVVEDWIDRHIDKAHKGKAVRV
jgi:hypothetical protein